MKVLFLQVVTSIVQIIRSIFQDLVGLNFPGKKPDKSNDKHE